jgi:membrane fusion protein, peptide pheromone/bacteriocin exporter
MQNQIFPTEIIDNTTEVYLPRVTVRGQLIYSILLLSIIAGIASLPFIFVDVSVKSTGIIRTQAEKTEIKSLVSGRLTEVNIADNQTVISGQHLFTVTTEDIETQLSLNAFQEIEKQHLIDDLDNLTRIEISNLFAKHTTLTPIYTQQLNTFRSQLQENLFHQKTVKRELDADNYLFKEKVIARRELDARKYEMTKLIAEYETAFNRQISQWQAERNQLKIELTQLRSNAQQLQQQKELYIIKSPIVGNIQQITGKYEGSYVQTGEVLGIISPDSSLLVECYVSPYDIGLLKPNMKTNFQIDAFNYNEWGLVSGSIMDIAKDFVLVQDKPVFKVKCKLNQTTLTLKNGYIAQLKKGMTLRARFVVTERSLYQLLYDKIDDWLNPRADQKI